MENYTCPGCHNVPGRGRRQFLRSRITGRRQSAWLPCSICLGRKIELKIGADKVFEKKTAWEKEFEVITEAEYYEPDTEAGRQERERLLSGLRASRSPADGEGPRPVADYIGDVGF